MSNVETPEVWVIRHKETKEMFKAPSGKSSWKKKGHAKSAWATHCDYGYGSKENVEKLTKPLGVLPYARKMYNNKIHWEFPKFDQQDTWEVVRLTTEIESRLEQAERLLKVCFGVLDSDSIKDQIIDYFGEKV